MSTEASVLPKHDKLVAVAKAELGVAEHPNGSNTGERVKQYQAATWLPGTGWPWCAAFCVWSAKKAGFVLAYLGAGAYDWYDNGAEKVGRKIPASKFAEVKAGDWAVWKLGAGHISIVLEIKGGMVYTIDGNVNNMVAYRTRPLSQVYGFVGLAEAPVKPPVAPKPPTFEVTSSENGKEIVFYSGGDAVHVAERLEAILKQSPAGVTIRARPKKK